MGSFPVSLLPAAFFSFFLPPYSQTADQSKVLLNPRSSSFLSYPFLGSSEMKFLFYLLCVTYKESPSGT